MKIISTWGMAVLSLMDAWRVWVYGRSSDNSVAVVLTRYYVKNSCRDRFLQVLSGYVLHSLQTTGNIMTEAYYEKGDPCMLWVFERWDNRALYVKSRRSDMAKAVRALTKTALVSHPETLFIQDTEPLSIEDFQYTTESNDEPITIMLFVDVKAGTEDLFRSMNRAVKQASLTAPDVLIFLLSQLCYHKTRFIIYKKVRNWEAFRHHLKDPTLEPVLQFLQTSIKDPPFEKGYHYLIQFAPL
ncbi:MAG: hypothetical protein J7621_30615 [Niastella sp.]|nr:hypothetical protein [Niastella sp.]